MTEDIVVFKSPTEDIVPSGVTNCRNLPFDGGAKRPKSWAKTFASKGENEWSHHQCLFEENVKKTIKDEGLCIFENEGSRVVYAWGRY